MNILLPITSFSINSNFISYITGRFNAEFTRTLQKSLSWAKSTQFLVLIVIYLRSIIILSSHERLGLPKDLFPVDVNVKNLKVFLPSSILAIRPDHLDLMIILSERYKLWSSSLWSLFHSPFASLLGTNTTASANWPGSKLFLARPADLPLRETAILYHAFELRYANKLITRSIGYQSIRDSAIVSKMFSLEIRKVEISDSMLRYLLMVSTVMQGSNTWKGH